MAEITIDQRLRWLQEGAWEWRFPTVVAPRYLGAKGRVEDARRVEVEVADKPLDVRLHVGLEVRDRLAEAGRLESPSHAMTFGGAAGAVEATLADPSGAPLDRDVVVRWAVAAPNVGLEVDLCRPEPAKGRKDAAYGLLTIVPPKPDANPRPLPRDLIVLLDTSGSMSGEPLAQAKRVASALVDTLGDGDRLELISFSTEPTRWKAEPVAATAKARHEALDWIAALEADGGTEMRSGIFEALRPLSAEAQRQVVLVTDGEIGFEGEVVSTILATLPESSRLHTVGVGSAVNRSLTAPAARAGRGVEVIIGLGEDPERAAARVLARTRAPLVTNVEVDGDALEELVPARLPDLYAGAPLQVAVALRPVGGTLRLRGRTADGAWQQQLRVPPVAVGEGARAVTALWAREKVEDLEMKLAAKPSDALRTEVERIGVAFQVATRLTSWVAVSEEPTVDPKKPTKRVKMPQALPAGMSAEGLGLVAKESYAAMPVARHHRLLSRAAPVVGDVFDMAPPPPPAGSGRDTWLGEIFPSDESDAAPRSTPPAGEVDGDLDVDSAGPSEDRLELRGTVRSRNAGELVVEVELDVDLDWSPEADALLAWQGGARAKALVDRSATTEATRLIAGQVLRLVLKLPKRRLPAGEPVRVDLKSGRQRLTIVLVA